MQEGMALTAFYEAIADDARIGPTHICLYVALLHEYRRSQQKGFIEIDRNTLMKHARVSRKTYNKCMKELQAFGYINYHPSLNPLVSSKVYLKPL